MDKIKHLQNKYSVARYDLIVECEGDELRLYLYLKLYAINKHEAFPTYNTIKKDLNWHKSKISRVINKIEEKGRLRVGKRKTKTKGGKQSSNIYDITWYDKVNERGSKNRTKVFQNQNTLLEKGGTKIGTELLDIRTNNNITNIAKQSFAGKDINDLIDLFGKVNPAHNRLFKNKIQRKALEELVEKWGVEKIEWIIKVLPKTNEIKYAPTITTPVQLADKLGNLIVFLKKSKIKNKPNIAKIK